MKNTILSIVTVSCMLIGVVSCKETKETETVKEVVAAAPTAITYNVNTTNSAISWKGEKPTGSHNGTIMIKEGSIAVNNGAIEGGSFVIDMNTITSLDLEGDMKANLENHLKGTVEGKEVDFFNVTKYPTATFEITNVTVLKESKTKIEGNLTIKEKTNAVSFEATISVGESGLKIKGEPFMIDRTKWDVNYGSKTVFDNLKDKFINDDVEIKIAIAAKQ